MLTTSEVINTKTQLLKNTKTYTQQHTTYQHKQSTQKKAN